MTFEEILAISPYSLNKIEKHKLLTSRLVELTRLHKRNCPEYSRLLASLEFDPEEIANYKQIPFLPVRLFKELSLRSVSEEDVFADVSDSELFDTNATNMINALQEHPGCAISRR